MKKYLKYKGNKNLNHFIRDVYNGQKSIFKNELEKKLVVELGFPESRVSAIMQACNGHRKLTKEMQKEIENAFNLKKEILNKQATLKKPNYILISVTGNLAENLLEDLKGLEIVDEISVIRGDADLFVRVYGTEEEIDNFLLEDLHSCTNVEISGTITLTTLKDRYFERYPIKTHPNRKTNPSIWF